MILYMIGRHFKRHMTFLRSLSVIGGKVTGLPNQCGKDQLLKIRQTTLLV